MKTLIKRSLAYVLLACMLLSILPATALAANNSYTFNFGGWAKDGDTLDIGAGPVDGSKAWELVAKTDNSDGLVGINTKTGIAASGETYIRWKNQDETSFVAFKLTGIADGVYNMDFAIKTGNGGASANIYVMPYSDLPDTAKGILTKVNGMQSAGVVGCYKKSSAVDPTSLSSVSFSGSSDGSYAIVLKATANVANMEINKTTFMLCGITLSPGSGSPAPTTPAPTSSAPTSPAASEPAASEPDATEGEFTPDPGSSSVYVGYELVADDCVSSSYYTHAAIGVVNGHDYLYLATRGGKLIVYDVDEKKQIDSVLFDANTPRGVTVDENGMVWIAGVKGGMYKYDPFTNVGKLYPIDFKGIFGSSGVAPQGITSDGNGKLYFGTMYGGGTIACYDTATNKCTVLTDTLGIGNNTAESTGVAGMVLKNGCLYFGIDGDLDANGEPVHAIVKYNIATGKIEDSLDIRESFGDIARKTLDHLSYADGMIFGGFLGKPSKAITIDISGSKLKYVQLPDMYGQNGAASEEINGKHYFVGYIGDEQTKGFAEYDVATNTSKLLLETNTCLRLEGNNGVTIEGDADLPGVSILIPYNDEEKGVINLSFFNPQTNKFVTWEANIGQTGGAGSVLRAITVDPTGRYVYVGAYGNTGVSIYDTETGKIVDNFNTFSHQTDSLLFYNGYLYAGNYSAGTITQIDPETHELKPLFSLRYSVFEQCRMHTMAAGGNKVFAGPCPTTGLGGVLVWYDLEKNLTYVAGGPNPEDVYYADTSGLNKDSSVTGLKYTWYNAVTGEVADFDDDDDGKDDVYLPDGTRRFRGPVQDQMINNLIYKDGYIYGTTSISGNAGFFAEDTTQAVIFVYDVNAMKLVATCDVSTQLEGFTDQVPIIDQLAADPDVDGKFWGVISDTLFTVTIDPEAKTFDVKEEFSVAKDQYYSYPGTAWNHRDIIFDGEYLYVGFTRNKGLYMVRKYDASEHYLIGDQSPNNMVLAADGNIYWVTNASSHNPNGLNVYRIGGKTDALNDAARVDTVLRMIAALDRKITRDDKAAIEAARAAYEKLTDEEKAKITNLNILVAAEEAYANLPAVSTTTILIIVLCVVVLAGAAATVVLILKKKKTQTN